MPVRAKSRPLRASGSVLAGPWISEGYSTVLQGLSISLCPVPALLHGRLEVVHWIWVQNN